MCISKVKVYALAMHKFVLMRSPGFEPGLSGWEPDVLTKLDYDRKHFLQFDLFLLVLGKYIDSHTAALFKNNAVGFILQTKIY